MSKYVYTGPMALRDLQTMEQFELSALPRGTRKVTKILAPVGLEPTRQESLLIAKYIDSRWLLHLQNGQNPWLDHFKRLYM